MNENNSASTGERREFPRVPAAHLIYIGSQQAWQPVNDMLAKTLDLSITGLAVELPGPLPVGGTYALTLSLHDELVTLPAYALRCIEFGDEMWEVGFEFRRVSKAYFKLLSKSFADVMV